MLRAVGLAEDLAEDALVTVLERWHDDSVPDDPGAWLMQTSKHRAIDRLRRDKLWRSREGEITFEIES